MKHTLFPTATVVVCSFTLLGLLAALQKESDIAAIKTKLAVDQAAMEKLRDHMNQQQAKMKSMMEGMKDGMKEGMMGNKETADKPATDDKSKAPTDHSAHQH